MTLIDTAEPVTDGLLPETWTSVDGIAFAEVLPGGRDFTQVQWTWRDPMTSLVPLYLQTENEPGHAGAELAGFIERFTLDSAGTVGASGRFYDTPIGVTARDLLLGGRVFGVSVDPTEDVQAELICEEEEDGICLAGRLVFSSYEIGGLTMTPFQGFDRAAIRLEGDGPAALTAQAGLVSAAYTMPTVPLPPHWYDLLMAEAMGPAPVVASITVPDTPPADWFEDPLLAGPTPLTITEEGHIFGHAALWGTCHLGLPGCETPFHDPDYSLFHLGYVETDGGRVAVGKITMATGHASTRPGVGMAEALAHYDNTGTQAAWIRAGEDQHGIWFSGMVSPELSDEDLRRLRAAPLSADWRPVGGAHRLVHLSAVNTPGYPVPRVASGFDNGALTAAIFTLAREDFDCGCGGQTVESELARQVSRLSRIVDALGLEAQAAQLLEDSLRG